MRASRGARERGELRPALFSAIETVIGEWTRVASCFLFDCTHKAKELFIRVTFNRGIIFFPPRGIASRFRKITMLRIVSSRTANGMCFNVNRRGEHPFVRSREATENRAREQSAPGIGIGIHLNIKHGRHIGRFSSRSRAQRYATNSGQLTRRTLAPVRPGIDDTSSRRNNNGSLWQVNAPILFPLRPISGAAYAAHNSQYHLIACAVAITAARIMFVLR